MYKAVIFDVFGVLVANAADLAFEKLGGDKELYHSEIRELYKQYDLGFINYETEHTQIAELLGVTYDEWLTAMSEQTQFNTQLVEYVGDLQVKTAFLSNIGEESVAQMREHLDLSVFDELIKSSEIGYIKPHPKAYMIAAERLGVEPEECIFIDDSPGNVAGAEAVGMKGIAYKGNKQIIREIDQLLNEK